MGNQVVGCCAAQGACCSTGRDGAVGTGNAPIVGASKVTDGAKDEVLGIQEVAPGMNSSLVLGPTPEEGSGAVKPPAAAGASSMKANSVEPADSAAGGDGQHQQESVTYEDGSTYTGQIQAGKRHGHGIWQSKTGQYDGQWHNDQQHGKGRQTWSDGRVYEGQFAVGKFSGTGKMVWHTQKGVLVYEGEYQDDLKHGQGKFVWADGRTYDGEWQKGKRWGQGAYVNARGEKKIGIWVDDKFERWLDEDQKKEDQ
eukprot:gnl/TRDRNA2_/TRDRNA2_197111_c0_seq1.p1 gnl/TRDRNA2_/TRDRNA2_197111_c0~~gnl/TRDRNA2_/TRDRNA2_197111_c0_seq1.p1  ORF type:complete len:254 (+),score=44.76 gnl/TRDRNA2_/TRDRNA2_197111_c0_seq1:57-818(+)